MKIIITMLVLSTILNAQLFEKINGSPSMIKKTNILAVKKNNSWQPGQPTYEFESHYDRQGHLIKEIEKNSGQIVLQKIFTYKDSRETQDICTEAIRKAEKNTSFSEVQESDFSSTCLKLKGKKIEMKLQFNPSPNEKSPRPFKTFLYYSSGDKSYEYAFDADLSMEYVIMKIFDKKNQISQQIKSDAEGKQIEKIVYRYSSQPLSVSIKYFDENDLLKKEVIKEYRTDSTLRIQTEIVYDNLEQIFSKNVIESDASGLPLREKHYDQNGDLNYEISYFYEYDEKANWIRMFKYKRRIVYGKKIDDELPPEIVSREIKYY